MKQVYREIYKETLNGHIIHYVSGHLKYEDIDKKDNYTIMGQAATNYSQFIQMIKDKKVKSNKVEVVTRFGKDVLRRCGWDWSYPIKEKDFEIYDAKLYIRYCNDYSINELRNSLPAEQYIDWCKDHGVTDNNIKLEL